MKRLLSSLWAWFVIVGFAVVMLYSFGFAFTELISPENALGLGFIVFTLIVLIAAGLNRAFDK